MKPFTKRVNSGFKSLKTWGKENLSPGKKTLAGATLAVFAGFSVTALASGFAQASAIGLVPVLVMTVSLLAISFLAALLAISLLELLARIPFWMAVALVTGIPGIMIFFHLTTPGSLLVFAIVAFFCALIGGSLQQFRKKWPDLKNFHKMLAISSLIIGVSGIAGGLTWLLHPGKPVEMPRNAAMSVKHLPPVLDMKHPGEPGPYTVGYLSYGSGIDNRRKEFGPEAALITQPVDGSSFLDAWSGFSGKMRTRYFGFDQEKLPLNAQVWYPEGEGPFPLVLIVHGNHLAQNYSDPGYAYLGELLGSRGYIMASVDQNFLNGTYTDIPKGLGNENDARGWLLLKHLEAWQGWNEQEDSPFFRKVDMDRIALIGHSRGGEAVGHAALFNRLPYYPDNANEQFDFNFNIRSIIAIAPCDGQYQPARTRTPLTDVNYLVLQGAHDADVSSYQGMRQFNRVSFSAGFDGFSAGVYIWGANHGQFNSVWGRTDFSSPHINFYNLHQLMSEEKQQTIAKTYISAFLDATLRNDMALRKMFADHRYARHWLPETVYITQFEHPGTEYVCTFMEDLDLSTATLDQSLVHAADLSIWREQTLSLNWGDYGTRALFLGWNTTENNTLMPAYHISWPAEALNTGKQSVLVFSLAKSSAKTAPPVQHRSENEDQETEQESVPEEKSDQAAAGTTTLMGSNDQAAAGATTLMGSKDQETPEATVSEETDEAGQAGQEDNAAAETAEFIDFTIRLVDIAGYAVEFPLSTFAPVQPTLKRKFTKLSFLQVPAESEIILQTFIFPLEQFACDHPEFDFENINCISFIFDITNEGVVVVNDIGFINGW